MCTMSFLPRGLSLHPNPTESNVVYMEKTQPQRLLACSGWTWILPARMPPGPASSPSSKRWHGRPTLLWRRSWPPRPNRADVLTTPGASTRYMALVCVSMLLRLCDFLVFVGFLSLLPPSLNINIEHQTRQSDVLSSGERVERGQCCIAITPARYALLRVIGI